MDDRNGGRRAEDRQYDKICKPKFDELDNDAKDTKQTVHTIHRIVSNGLQDKVKENNERIKALDNRVWLLMTGVFLSIALQILFQVV